MHSELTLREVDRALAELVRTHSGSGVLGHLAALCLAAEANGHACIDLADATFIQQHAAGLDVQALRRELTGKWLGDEGSAAAMVIDARQRLFLRRNFDHEQFIADQISARCVDAIPGSALDAELLQGCSADQAQALQAAVAHKLFLLTGGPGTGKTSLILRYLLQILQQADQPLRIALAAPTGKAAQRMAEAISAGADLLAQHLNARWQPHLHTLRELRAQTLHRLLGQRIRGGLASGSIETLPFDLIVVDEASMIDLGHFRALLQSCARECQLLVVGDPDQLSAISAGSPLADLQRALQAKAKSAVAELSTIHRSDRALQTLFAACRAGDLSAFRQAAADSTIQWCMAPDAVDLREMINDSAQQICRGEFVVNASGESEAFAALRSLNDQSILCSVRHGPWGSHSINRAIESQIKLHQQLPAQQLWYPGRRVMVRSNDANRGLFNGDIGLCLADADGALRVYFRCESDVRSFSVDDLPPHESAFALTVHKSQGSEYQQVTIVLPPEPQHALHSRQLLYTALTRAKSSLKLYASDEVVGACLAYQERRLGGLFDALNQRL